MGLGRRRAAARVLAAAALAVAVAACGGEEAAVPQPDASALTAPLPGITLPADALRPLVPAPDEVPPGMVPVLTGTGPRDAAAIAEFSADPAAARAALAEHGFERAYVAQYADPDGARVLSVVVARFADEAGARADLESDLAASSGEVLDVAPVGEQSQARRQPLPGDGAGELVTLRFRTGATTWLLAYGDRPSADASVAVGLGQRLVVREGQA